MAGILEGFHSFTCAPRVHLLTEQTIPAFSFPAEAGTHLPTPEGWKAELAKPSLQVLVTHDFQLLSTNSRSRTQRSEQDSQSRCNLPVQKSRAFMHCLLHHLHG